MGITLWLKVDNGLILMMIILVMQPSLKTVL